MADDIVQRLRWWAAKKKPPPRMPTLPGDCAEAADEIERLRAEIKTMTVEVAAKAANSETTLFHVIADIRQKSGVGAKPMLSELADAIAEKIKSLEHHTQGQDDD